MKKGIIGRKIGMTQIFDEKGRVVPVTVVEAGLRRTATPACRWASGM